MTGGDRAGPLVVNAALALIAAVLGSLLTLVVTGSVNVPDISGDNTANLQASDNDAISEPESDSLFKPAPGDTLSANVELANESLEEFRQLLQDSSDERSQLAQSIARLTTQVEQLQSDAINQQTLSVLEGSSPGEPDAGLEQAPPPRLSREQRRTNSLIAAGIDESSAKALLSRQSQYELARLDLVDLAEREGWADSDEFDLQLAQLDDQRVDLRTELGDEAYDRYLYERGRNNRVVIVSVIAGSEAEAAGLQVGDAIVNYASERIFSTRELQQATREGDRGELVDVLIDRQGQTLFFDVPRGPLGVSLDARKVNPS